MRANVNSIPIDQKNGKVIQDFVLQVKKYKKPPRFGGGFKFLSSNSLHVLRKHCFKLLLRNISDPLV
jgi:hypothetical protein